MFTRIRVHTWELWKKEKCTCVDVDVYIYICLCLAAYLFNSCGDHNAHVCFIHENVSAEVCGIVIHKRQHGHVDAICTRRCLCRTEEWLIPAVSTPYCLYALATSHRLCEILQRLRPRDERPLHITLMQILEITQRLRRPRLHSFPLTTHSKYHNHHHHHNHLHHPHPSLLLLPPRQLHRSMIPLA